MSDEITNYPVPVESDFSMVPEEVKGLPETGIVESDDSSFQTPSTQVSEGCLIVGGIIQTTTDVAIKTIDAVKDVAIDAIDKNAEIQKERIRIKGNENIEKYRSQQLADVEKRKSDNEAKVNISGTNANVAIVAINNDKVQDADGIVKILNASPITESVEEKPKKKKGFFARFFGGDD